VLTDAGGRRAAITQSERKAASKRAPVFAYIWAWESPAFGGKFGAVHGIDVGASFYQVRDAILGGGSAQGKLMCERLASAWVAFAKTGNPSDPHLPNWPAYDETTRATMIFDVDTRVENDPRAEIRKFWAAKSATRT